MAIERGKRTFLDKLKSKYRLVVLNDDTFEERASFRLSRFNVYVFFLFLSFILIGLTFIIIVFTPLKEYIPGYADVGVRKQVYQLTIKSDSLEQVIRKQEIWIQNIQNVILGRVDSTDDFSVAATLMSDSIDLDQIPEEDLTLREAIEKEEAYSVKLTLPGDLQLGQNGLEGLIPPVKGVITAHFNSKEEHFGVDLVASPKEPVKAVGPGTVIISQWTLDTGNVIAIQHDNNMVTFYKHNSVLLKKVGNFVNTGDVIAIIGNSGELSTGPHLHFELWIDKVAVDPEEHIVF